MNSQGDGWDEQWEQRAWGAAGMFCKVSVQGWVHSRRDFIPAADSWLWDEAEQELCVPICASGGDRVQPPEVLRTGQRAEEW